MGYDLHITRKGRWNDEGGPTISEAEWRHLIEDDSELAIDRETQGTMTEGEYIFAAWNGTAGVLGWHGGEISGKNPDEPLVRKMVQIAGRLAAYVQGDDGEVYREDGSSFQPEASVPAPSQLGIVDRIRGWFRSRRLIWELKRRAGTVRVGQRVKNPWGELGTVLEVDRKTNGGLGGMRVRLDERPRATHDVH